jgi:hypothetical protein
MFRPGLSSIQDPGVTISDNPQSESPDDIVFSYLIVPEGGQAGQALVRGSLYASDIDIAKRHVQTTFAPSVEVRPGLEVILLDSEGREIWRAPYLGRPQG